MAIALEAFSVVVRQEGIERLGGIAELEKLVPNSTFCHDDDLARCAFMDRGDAVEFIDALYLRGLETGDAAEPDVVLVTAFDKTMKPHCDWLQVQAYKKGTIGWLSGTNPEFIAAPRGWNPELDSDLERMSTEEAARRLKFLRREENVEVFLDRDSGRELYVGRTGLPLDQMYEEAKDFLMENMREPGGPVAALENEADFRRIIQMLQILSERRADSWTVHWLLGKAWHAMGDSPRAYSSLRRAFELEETNQAVTRELAGVCLEIGKTADAVAIAERAVAQEPENAELLTNLALSYLLDRRHDEATKAIDAAIQHAPDDAIARSVQGTINAVMGGDFPQPQRLADLPSVTPKPPPSFWTKLVSRFRR